MQLFSSLHDAIDAMAKSFRITSLANSVKAFLAGFSNRWISLVWLIVAIIPPTYLVAELTSVLQETSEQANPTQAFPSISRLADSLAGRLKEDPTLDTISGIQGIYPNGLLVRTGIKITAIRHAEKTIFRYENVPIYNASAIIVFSALWLILLYSIHVLGAKKLHVSNLSESKEAPTQSTESNTVQRPLEGIANAHDGIGILKDEVLFARRRAAEVHQRSSIMLAAGVMMSFVGLAVYYVSLSPVAKDDKIETFLMEGLRPTAMLVFVEALAWFLLKQYRSLSDEYRYFHRLAQRRADFLVAFMSRSSPQSAELELFLLTALLQEPASLVLKQGESTESLEGRKADTSNPILEMADRLLQRIPVPGAQKKDG